MANLEAVKFVESYKLERFITDGLNSGKFGHGAVEILSEIYVLETPDVAPVVHGRWVEIEDDFATVWRCSNCEEDLVYPFDPNCDDTKISYCPICGAKMDRKEQE